MMEVNGKRASASATVLKEVPPRDKWRQEYFKFFKFNFKHQKKINWRVQNKLLEI